jgi:hypothetical protein
MSAFVFAWPAIPQPPSNDSVISTHSLRARVDAELRDHVTTLDALDRTSRTDRALERK